MWTQLVASHNIEKALQEYTALNTDIDGAIFFSNTPKSPIQTLIYSPGVLSFYNPHVTIPERFSRLDYERQVRAAAEKLATYIESLAINPEEKKRFANFLIKESINYIKKYQEKYLNLYDSCLVEVHTDTALLKLLSELSKPTAVFYEFLKAIQHHTTPLSEPLLTVKYLDEFNQFAFLSPILTAKEGKSPIEEYQKLIGEISKELQENALSPAVSFASLQLKAIEKMTLNIFHQTPASYMKRAEECLTQLGVPERFRAPFYQPIHLLYKIGLKELKTTIERYWKTSTYPQIAALFDKFPFNLEATACASFDEVSLLLNPKSEFYTNLEKMMAVVLCQNEDQVIPIDQEIHQHLSRASKLAKALWDFEGKPKPLTIKVTTLPIRPQEGSTSTIIKSCLMVGEQSVYNINQDPSWQTLNIHWWQEDRSLIGMTVVQKDFKKKAYLTVESSPSLWSFFTLLKKGAMKENGVWEWSILKQESQGFHSISFKFDADPRQQLGI